MGGGSSQPATTTTIQKTELPAWLEGVTKENIAIADQISKQPYQPYNGQLTAGFAPEQEQAFDYMQRGIGMTDPIYQRAIGVTNDAANYNPYMVAPGQIGYDKVTAPSFLTGDINAYMNPYINNVENAALSRLEGATKQAINRVGDQARSAGAFGGSRQGIAEGVTLGEASKSAGELSANLRSQGFNTAAGLMQADQQRAMQAALANQAAGITTGQTNLDALMRAQLANQNAGLQNAQLRVGAANQLGSLAGLAQNARLQDASILEGIGGQRQAMQQALLDEAYARFNEQRNFPLEMLNVRLGATSATPYSQTTTATSTRSGGGSSNNFLSGLGAVGTGVGIAANLASIFAF